MNNVTRFRGKSTNSSGKNATNSQRITRIYLLGMMRAISPEDENILPHAKKTRAVLAYLCLMHGERLLRSRVAGIIWDRSGEAQARESLRHALNELNRTGHWHLEKDHDAVRLDVTGCWIDAFEIPENSDLLLEGLYGISPSFDQWLVGERIRLEHRWQTRLEKDLSGLIADAAAPELRAAAARKLLNVVPTHEAAVRNLMSAFVDLDDDAQAIREYERFRQVVSTNLGMPPSDKTIALYEAIRLGSRVRATRALSRTEHKAWNTGEFSEGKDDLTGKETSGADTALHIQPSIAVLPFRNLSGELGHDHVSEGLAEDLVEALSRVQGLFVVSRLSAAVFRTQDRPPVAVSEALGVRYVLSGSIRLVRDRLRLIVELTDAANGVSLWISRIDEKFSDLLEVQGRLAETVVRSVAAAIAREPQYAAALAWLAHWHVMRVGQGWSPDEAHDAARADYLAKQAVECDATEPMAFAVQGHVSAYFHKDFDLALTCFDRALQINPNASRAWLWSAYTYAWIGEGSRAVQNINRAMALSPYDALICAYSGGASLAYLADGQYARAIEFAMRCIRENRSYTTAYKALVLALILSGREAEARGPVNQLRLLEPGFTVRQFRRRSPACTGTLGERYCEAFAKAGVPLFD